MLVLTRKVGQTLLIAGEIEIRITSIKGNRCQVGIACPRHMSVVRGEINEEPEPEPEPEDVPA